MKVCSGHHFAQLQTLLRATPVRTYVALEHISKKMAHVAEAVCLNHAKKRIKKMQTSLTVLMQSHRMAITQKQKHLPLSVLHA